MLTLPRLLLTALALLAVSTFASAQDKAPKAILEKSGELTEDDPLDKVRTKSYSKTFDVKFEGGKVYKVELTSSDFDTFVRLEKADGKQLTSSDHRGPRDKGSDLLFKITKTGDFKIIVTSSAGEKTGSFKLFVGEPTRFELISMNVKAIKSFNIDERDATLKELAAYLNDRGKLLTPADALLAKEAVMGLESTRMRGLGDWCLKLSKAMDAADNASVKSQAKSIAGLGRRLNLPGNSIEVKGNLLDGTPIDWQKYRGKIVLVDFWATWCPPCVAEVPNIAKMYNAYHEKGFDVVGISLDRDAEAPGKFMKKRELPWVCIDKDDGRILANYYAVGGIPFPILVDKQGKVVSTQARGPELGRLLAKYLGPLPEPKDGEKKSDEKKTAGN